MAKLETSYGGYLFKNARLLTKEEIIKKYPITDDSSTANLTREFFGFGYDILYGEKPDLVSSSSWKQEDELTISALRTAAYLYNVHPRDVMVGVLTDLSEPNVVYVAVKQKKHRFFD